MIGTTVGSYRITHKVSVGGMGTVYKAEHTLIGKLAAVKILHPELRNNHDVVNRFFNEAKATTQIKHPGIVEVFDFGYLPSGDGYIVMEFLEGVSLARRLKKGKMVEGKAAMLLRGVCSALAAAHAKKIVHRDLKPDNIFLCPDPDSPTGERPKILDFGIAKLTDMNITGSGSATKTGLVMGTPTYMSPEQCKGTGAIDHRADLYALGCIFYELLTGVPPFVAEGAGELIGMHLYVEPEPPTTREPTISAAAETLILSLLDKDPAQRPQSARELGQRFSLLAQAQGWSTTTGPVSANDAEPDVPDDEPGDDAPAPATPLASSPAQRATPPVHVTANPTTLSGAASQSVIGVHGSRKMLWIGAIGLATAAIVTVALVMVTGSKKSPTPAPALAPIAAPTPPPVTPPPPPPVTPPPVTPPPVTPPVVTPPPSEGSATVAHTPDPPKHVRPPPKHVPPKVDTPKPPPQGTGTGSAKILIEKDI